MTDSPAVKKDMLERAKAIKPRLVELRRAIHSQPELSFQEFKTAELVVRTLAELGMSVQPAVGKTGVIAEIGKGRTIILRADMDALPIQEQNDCSYASTSAGVMHACGHDVHTACLLGAAILLSQSPPERGCVRFMFQPAEETVNAEGKSGATLMIEDGATTDAEGVIALHVDPRLPAGKITVSEGVLLAACDSFEITITGQGTHGAFPELGIDPVVIAAQVVQAMQTIISRRKSALEPAVLTIGGIKSSTYAPNIVPESIAMTGTVRYFSQQAGQAIRNEIENCCSIVESLGARWAIHYKTENPALNNDHQITNLVKYVGRRILGSDSVQPFSRLMGSEDFSFLSVHLPSCYFGLGCLIEGSPRVWHTPNFDINEDALPVGAAMLAACALQFLGE